MNEIEISPAAATLADAGDLYGQLTDWLDEQGWSYADSDARDQLNFGVRPSDAAVRVFCWVLDVPQCKRLTVCTHFYVRVPAHRRAEVALALARINNATSVGNFEMDTEDGEVRTRTWHESELPVTTGMLERTVVRALDLAEQYQAALLAIAFGNAPAAQVLDMARRPEPAALQ